MDSAPPALPAAVFLVLALGLAGVAHVAWLRSAWSLPLAVPIDGGLCWRGCPLLGRNKTWRGLLAMPLAAAATFSLAAANRSHLPDWLAAGVWPLSSLELAGVGLVCGLSFMLAELPNSLLKRRVGIAPGEAATRPALRWPCLLIDRLDSSLGALAALSLLVPVRGMTWLWALGLGAGLHWLFSLLLYRLKLKRRIS